MREYVIYYFDIFKVLQNRKTALLRSASKVESARKSYISRTHLTNSISLKLKFFRLLQSVLLKLIYLIHYDFNRQLYVNLNASKKFEFKTIIYHVIEEKIKQEYYSSRIVIQSVLFISRLLSSAKTNY